MKKTAAAAVMLLSVLGGTVAVSGAASAAPKDKCAGDRENFQIVAGQCVSDGKAERLT